MTKILIVNTSQGAAIPFYRSDLPFKTLAKDLKDELPITLKFQDHKDVSMDWKIMEEFDLIFMSNPTTKKDYDILMAAHANDIPVWVDYDDDYLSIPANSSVEKIARTNQTTEWVCKCVSMADQVTVSVEFLKDQLERFNGKIVILPNAFPIHKLNGKLMLKPKPAIHQFISWRGANSLHRKNLNGFKDSIARIGHKNRNWMFHFFGNPVEDFFNEGEFNFTHKEGINDVIAHCVRMQELSCKIHIVPLNDIVFNHSKSMISWMEGTLAGSAVLAPGWLEWRRPGIINYNNKEEFETLLNEMIEGKHNLQSCYEKSLEYIVNNLSLKIVNKERLKLLNRLLLK
jgi:hypothetical protein